MSAGASIRNFLRMGSSTVAGIDPNTIEITHVRVPLRNLRGVFDGLTIAHISDLHMGEWMTLPRMLNVVERVNALRPDVIAVTGDFVGSLKSKFSTTNDLTNALQTLESREGAFGVLGNHDHYTNARAIRRAIRASGTVRLLSNQHAVIERVGERLYIAGVDDIEKGKHDLGAALEGIPDGAPVALLAHEPDFADEVARCRRVGLQLSGHTHGGQVRLPGIGALVLPEFGKKYPMGLYDVDGMALYVNRGVGMVGWYVRLNCRPEITLITLTTTV